MKIDKQTKQTNKQTNKKTVQYDNEVELHSTQSPPGPGGGGYCHIWAI